MTAYQVLYWYDIPLQVRAGGRRERVSRELSARFQEAVDSAAMAAGLTGTDAYLEAFRWSDQVEVPGTPSEIVDRIAAELEASFDTIDWRATAAALRASRA